MNDGMLSQEEINALLAVSQDDQGEVNEGASGESDEEKEIEVSKYLSSIEVDTLGEIGNISFGSSATTLSTLLNEKVDITTPKISILRKSNLCKEFPFDHVKIQVNYVQGFSGENLFVIKSTDAAVISDIMLGGDGRNPETELNEIHLSAVQEAMNQMMGAAATSMSTIFNKKVNISPPTTEFSRAIDKKDDHQSSLSLSDETLVKVSFQLRIGELIDSSIMQLIPFPFAHELVEELLSGQQPEPETETVTSEEIVDGRDVNHQANQTITTTQSMENRSEQQVKGNQHLGNQVDHATTGVQQAMFSEFKPVDLNKNEQRNLDNLLDIPLKVTVELGRTQRPIKEILELSTGSIVELDKLAGEPVDILVNQKLIAQGEVVVIDENFGVRVTDIISKTDRLMNLN
ncbi:MAG TPA: flagellar motor switch phosphatase FliY [Candidatus Dormibacteraeota bacterium]|nr:flagellar motor switch phosphatase FliY [Candidatus Dormibacteraeota bacterium]